ncbi:hypothetical protein DFH09DRAFT_1459522 [Mycena vulgaris]|nr:hypothetical protein DFH09DRAFT_1459522 [Mycena vulgaris]
MDALRTGLEQARSPVTIIDAHLALVSPVRKLPDDIVQTIFEATLPSTRHPAISSDESPLLLCQIGRSWRAIALATPRLWARIHVVVPSQLRTQSLTDAVISWLARSGRAPLEFSVVFSRTSQGSRDITQITPGADTLDPVLCPRLRHLELQGFEAVSDESLLAFIRARALLSLSRVRVTICRPMQRDIMPDLQDAIAGGLDVVLKYITPPEIVYSPLEGTERHSA